VRDRSNFKSWDPLEVAWVAGAERHRIRECARRDERVVCSRSRFAPRRAKSGRYAAKCQRTVPVERNHVEVRLGLLQVLLPGPTLGSIVRDVGPPDNSASVIALITDSSGSSVASDSWPRRITVGVSSIPGFVGPVTAMGRQGHRYRAGVFPGSPVEDFSGDGSVRLGRRLNGVIPTRQAGQHQPPTPHGRTAKRIMEAGGAPRTKLQNRFRSAGTCAMRPGRWWRG
jgi:hypothetical protein